MLGASGLPLTAQAKSAFSTDEEQTSFEDITTYNNFYEFGTDKGDPERYAKLMKTSPWSVTVDGECEKPGKLNLGGSPQTAQQGRAHLPFTLCGRLVDGDPVARFPAGGFAETFRADLESQIRAL